MNRKSNKPPQVSKKRFETIYPIFLFCFSFLLYSQSIHFKYTMFDDDGLLMENKDFFTKDGSFKTIFTTDAFLTSEGTFYRPLQNISFLADVKIFGGMDMRMFHFTNILLFAFISFSLYFLLLKFSFSPFIAFLGALLYTVHPLFISSVAWIPARGDLLLTLFSILSFTFWISFLSKKKYCALILSWLCFSLALFTKETAALLPVLFLFYFFAFESKFKIDFKIILFGALILCTGMVWIILRTTSIHVYDSTLTIDLFLRNLLAIPAALAMFAAPYDFSTAPEFTHLKIIIGLALLILVLVMTAVKSSQIRRKKLFYLMWFLFLLFPTFFAKTKEWDYLEHRFLLPLIGILIFLLSFIQNISKVKVTIITSVLVIVFSTVSFFKTKIYANPHTFCEAIRNNKNNPETYYFLKGNLDQISEKYEKALKAYNIAISYNPNHIKSLNNRGTVNQQLGNFSGALSDYSRAIDLGLKNYHIFKNRGDVRLRLGDYSGAIEDYESFLEYEHLSEIYALRGKIYYILEENEKALADFNQCISEGYSDSEVYAMMGVIHGKMGDIENAIVYLTKALSIDSNSTFAYYNRAFAKYLSSDFSGALADCEKLLAIDNQYPNAQILRSKVIIKMKN